MKKSLVKFLATSMTAFTLMGTSAAFAPAAKVFAAETEAASDASGRTREYKTVYAGELDSYLNYLKELVGNTEPYRIEDNCKMYRVGNMIYAISRFESSPEMINETFNTKVDADAFYEECLKKGMIDRKYDIEYYEFGDFYYFASATITGSIPRVSFSIVTYPYNPAETIKITADRTMIRPGEGACLQMHLNEGADEDTVNWRFIGEDGVAEFCSLGKDAFVTGCNTGSVMVVAETKEGVRDCIQIDIVDF